MKNPVMFVLSVLVGGPFLIAIVAACPRIQPVGITTPAAVSIKPDTLKLNSVGNYTPATPDVIDITTIAFMGESAKLHKNTMQWQFNEKINVVTRIWSSGIINNYTIVSYDEIRTDEGYAAVVYICEDSEHNDIEVKFTVFNDKIVEWYNYRSINANRTEYYMD